MSSTNITKSVYVQSVFISLGGCICERLIIKCVKELVTVRSVCAGRVTALVENVLLRGHDSAAHSSKRLILIFFSFGLTSSNLSWSFAFVYRLERVCLG